MGSRRRISSTALTCSTKRLQSRLAHSRRPVTELPVDTWSVACRWFSVRTASSGELPAAFEGLLDRRRERRDPGPNSYIRWRSWVT